MRSRSGWLLGSFLLLSSCDAYFSNLRIENRSRSPVENLTIEYASHNDRLGRIEPGEEIIFTKHVSGEGAPVIRFDIRGRPVTFETCYYTATLPPRGVITIRDDSVDRRCE